MYPQLLVQKKDLVMMWIGNQEATLIFKTRSIHIKAATSLQG
jgi:hypothetical protein